MAVARDLSRLVAGGAPGPVRPDAEAERAAAAFVAGVGEACDRLGAATWQQVAEAALWYVRFDLGAAYEGDAWDVWACVTRQPQALCNCVAGSVLVALAVWAAIQGPPFAVFACEEHCFCGTEDGARIFETIHAGWYDRKTFAGVLELRPPGPGLSVFTTYGGLARLLVAAAASSIMLTGGHDRLGAVVRYGEERCATLDSPDVMLWLARAESEKDRTRRREAARRGLRRVPASAERFNRRNFRLLRHHAG